MCGRRPRKRARMSCQLPTDPTPSMVEWVLLMLRLNDEEGRTVGLVAMSRCCGVAVATPAMRSSDVANTGLAGSDDISDVSPPLAHLSSIWSSQVYLSICVRLLGDARAGALSSLPQSNRGCCDPTDDAVSTRRAYFNKQAAHCSVPLIGLVVCCEHLRCNYFNIPLSHV